MVITRFLEEWEGREGEGRKRGAYLVVQTGRWGREGG
jgi:hypothetical protein